MIAANIDPCAACSKVCTGDCDHDHGSGGHDHVAPAPALRTSAGSAPRESRDNAHGTTTDATSDACTVCAPLGAVLVYKGIASAVPLVHGGQGCATYIRRYLISHFREPMDVASSSFSEHTTIFGGQSNLYAAIDALRENYGPALIGISTTCLAETIGEDVAGLLRGYRAANPESPELINVATPSYAGTHQDGFHATVAAVVKALAAPGTPAPAAPIALFPGMVSPADLRHLRELCTAFGLGATLVPDYSLTLDGPSLRRYAAIPAGGTTMAELRALGCAKAALTLGRCAPTVAGEHLAGLGVPHQALGLPVGLRETDAFVAALSALSGQPMPPALALERGRLIDAYVDGHKVLFGVRAAVVGDHDTVAGLCAFLTEIGVDVVLAGGGGRGGHLAKRLVAIDPVLARCEVCEDADHTDLRAAMARLGVELVIGPSKCQPAARALDLLHLRVGFPVHDRFGAGRQLITGYSGALRLFDELVNLILARKQERSEVGYAYL
jgi:nitrogenase molybdenum-iron protein NifN